jgi:hypothetical protein
MSRFGLIPFILVRMGFNISILLQIILLPNGGMFNQVWHVLPKPVVGGMFHFLAIAYGVAAYHQSLLTPILYICSFLWGMCGMAAILNGGSWSWLVVIVALAMVLTNSLVVRMIRVTPPLIIIRRVS